MPRCLRWVVHCARRWETLLTKQAVREIYLKPFEEAVKIADPYPGKIAMMSSYNYVGTELAGGCFELLNNILRGEWGFRGMVLTDFFGNYGYMDDDRAIRGGSDIMLGTAGNQAILDDRSSATSVLAMRQATKNIFFTNVNSSVYESYVPEQLPSWMVMMFIIDGIILVLMAAAQIYLLRSYKKKKGQTQLSVS